MPLKSAPSAGFLRQAESLCVPNSMIPRPNMPKISAYHRHCSPFSGESTRRLGSIALRDRARIQGCTSLRANTTRSLLVSGSQVRVPFSRRHARA
jgi:hypothetical protein